jgi:nucleotide-binding universal stress UspA family protein
MIVYSTQTDFIILKSDQIVMTNEIDINLIRHIVVPFDDSGYSIRALQYSVMLAKKFNSKITLLAIEQSTILGSSFLDMKDHQTILEKKKLGKLQEKFKTLENSGKKSNILIESMIMFSSYVAQSILSFSSSKKADLIVMGTRGKGSSPSYMRLGSVAIDVSQISPSPVILIK